MRGLNKELAPIVAKELRRYMPNLVEVVRCKDCRYWGLTNFIIEPTGWCGRQEKPRKPDWYCADGERKGKEDDSD